MNADGCREVSAEERAQLVKEFDAAWARGTEQRINYSFFKTYKPVMEDSPFRSWKTTREYRRWCRENLPAWLGYGD